MNSDSLLKCLNVLGVLAIIAVGLTVLWSLLSLAHQALTLPMQRAERARLFLDQIDFSLQQGLPIEGTLISLAQSRDMTMGVYFHLLAAWLEQGTSLKEGLNKVPQFLPPQVNAMLLAGLNIGDLGKVVPACRQLLKDAVSQTRSALNYLVILTVVLTPTGVWVMSVLKIVVLPKFREIAEGGLFNFKGGSGVMAGFDFIWGHEWDLIDIQILLLVLVWLGVLVFVGGPRLRAWFPIVQRVQYLLPWRRKRLQRDFSTILAVLLDSGVPEPEAVKLAADCTANSVFRSRAARVLGGLERGERMTEAIEVMDGTGEFGWRLTNAVHTQHGFLKALAGWHESLDAKAFQEEQAAAHGITSALVVWSGIFIGTIVVSVFGILISFINAGVLW